jgi:hypothetical protein
MLIFVDMLSFGLLYKEYVRLCGKIYPITLDLVMIFFLVILTNITVGSLIWYAYLCKCINFWPLYRDYPRFNFMANFIRLSSDLAMILFFLPLLTNLTVE